MRDLEHVDVREPIGEERRIDAFLDVTHKKGAPIADPAEQHDRYVVDARPSIRRGHRHLATDRPQDLELDLVHREPITGGETEAHGRAWSTEIAQPRGVARPRPAHPGLEHPRNVVTLEQQR